MIFDVNAWTGSFPFRDLGDTSPASLIERMDNAGIQWAAVSSIDAAFHRNSQPANRRLAAELAPYSGRLLGLATINPAYVGWERDLDECHLELGMKGVRLVPQYQGFEVNGPECRLLAAACRERGLPLVIAHRLEDSRQRHWLDPGKSVSLNQVADLVAAVPGATVVVTNVRSIAGTDLLRRPDLRDLPWYVDLSLAEVHDNFFGPGDILSVLEQAGPEHVLFGTHMPFSYESCALVKRHILPVDAPALEQISYRTALRLFGHAVE